MGAVSGLSPRHRLLALFLATTLVPLSALAWLGWQFVEQDRQLERQRVHDALEAVTSATAAGIERELSALDRSLASLLQTRPPSEYADSIVVVRFAQSGVAASAGVPLLYHPVVSSASVSATRDQWRDGERLEFEQEDLAGAIGIYRVQIQNRNPEIRAGALLRLARALKKAGRSDEALSTYATLATVPAVLIDGVPADLIARRARIDLLDRIGNSTDLRTEATTLSKDLSTGRWALDRTTYLAFVHGLEKWAEPSSHASKPALALSEAVATAWLEWHERHSIKGVTAGRATMRLDGLSLLELWREDGEGLLFFAATPDYLATAWRSVWPGDGVSVSLVDDQGNTVIGAVPVRPAFMSARAASETRLPWTLRVSAELAPDAIVAVGRTRRKLMLAGLALLTVLVAATGYLVNRALRRELAVAKLQADFVSAVSHEFRSPLTSLTHLISLLRGEFQPTDERRRQYYDVLARETARLHRFVETLLDFGRIQAGAGVFRLTRLAPVPVVRQLVDEFSRDPACGSHVVTFEEGDRLPMVSADAEALRRAVWNLLEVFIRHRGRALGRQRLIDAAWGRDTFVTDRVVDNQVTNLRKKIESHPSEPAYVRSVRGFGYRFDG